MSRDYTADWDGNPARPATRGYGRFEELPYVLGEGTVRRYAQEIADEITRAARTEPGPVVWVTGNSYMPAFRSFSAAEHVWNAGNNDDGELFAFLAETVEDHLSRANVALESPDYDNALYAVDLNRWQYREFSHENYDAAIDLNDEWEPKE